MNNLLNNVSYSLEYMDRAIRMAQKDLTGDCVGTAKNNYFTPPSPNNTSIRFLTYDTPAVCLEFSRQGNQLMVRRSSDSASANLPLNYDPLTPAELSVNDIKFEVLNDGQDDQKQPRVGIHLVMSTQEPKPQQLNLQTTICQRNPDFAY